MRTQPANWRREAFAGLLCLAGGLSLLPIYRTAGLNNDSTVYMRIASHYVHGRWDEAINGYWSPLFSWMIAPLMGFGLDPPTALRLVCVLAAVGTLLVFRALARQIAVSSRLIDLASVGVAAYLFVFCMTRAWGLTPDVLLAGLLLLYLALLWARPRTVRSAAAAGLVAGLCYLAKAYALPFFLVHFTATLMWEAWRVRSHAGRHGAPLRWAAGVLCFFLVAAPWAIVLSRHHGHVTFTTTGGFNLSFMNPATENPIYTHGLIPPPGPHGISAWEDPAALPIEEWRWWRSPRDFAVGVRHMLRNMIEAVKHVANQSAVAFLLGLAGAAIVVWTGRPRRRRELIAALFAAALYSSGYILTARWPDARYLIPVSLLLALCVMSWAEWERRCRPDGRLALGLVAAVALGYLLPAGATLVRQRSDGQLPGVVAASLTNVIESHHRIAAKDDWELGAELSYWLDARFYGTTRPENIEGQLREHEIDFFVVWRSETPEPEPPGRKVDPGWDGSGSASNFPEGRKPLI